MLEPLLDFLLSTIELFRFWIVLQPYERGVQLRLGRFKRGLDPGLYLIAPFAVDRCLVHCIAPTTHSLGDESITTRDGKSVGFHAIVTYEIADIKKALLDVEDVTHAVLDAASGEIGRVLREATWEEIQAADILDKLTRACRKRGWRYGIEITAVQLAGVALVRSIRLMSK